MSLRLIKKFYLKNQMLPHRQVAHEQVILLDVSWPARQRLGISWITVDVSQSGDSYSFGRPKSQRVQQRRLACPARTQNGEQFPWTRYPTYWKRTACLCVYIRIYFLPFFKMCFPRSSSIVAKVLPQQR